MLRNRYQNYFEKKIAILGATSSSCTRSILRFIESSPTMTISSRSTAVTLNDEPNFCRPIPDDKGQAQVMIEILKKMKWSCFTVLYSNSDYGNSGKDMISLLAKQNNMAYQSAMIDNNFEFIKKFIENVSSDIVIFFADSKSIDGFFNYLKESNSLLKKIYIGGDTWVFMNYLKNISVNHL